MDLAKVDYMAMMRAEEEKKNKADSKKQVVEVQPQIENEESIDEADVDEANL